MPKNRYRLLIVDSHPAQYAPPMYRWMAQHPRLDIKVAYCSMQGAVAGIDPEFGVEVKWDVPLLEGYPWVSVPNRSWRPALGRFFGLINPGLWKLVRNGNYDAIFSYTGYAYLSFWIVAAAVKLSGIPLLSSTDAYEVDGANPKRWKSLLKRFCLPLIYKVNDIVVAPSQATFKFVESLGFPSQRISLTPGGFDNEWWAREAGRSDRSETRASLGIPPDCAVLLFCAKLQPRKRPHDVLRAVAKTDNQKCFLVFAGDGPLRTQLEAEAKVLGVANRVVFCGFVNQSRLPALYRAADLFVLPSEWDGCPLVVCEAMSCGCPVLLSDAIPGRFDLVKNGDTGFIYPCGDVNALASVLQDFLQDPDKLSRLSASASERVKAWSVPVYVEGLVDALRLVVRRQDWPVRK